MVDGAFKLNVGRQGFGSVNPEIRIIEGRIIEALLYNLPRRVIKEHFHYHKSFQNHPKQLCSTITVKFGADPTLQIIPNIQLIILQINTIQSFTVE